VYIDMECPHEYFERHPHLVSDEMKAAADEELLVLWKALAPHVHGYRTDRMAQYAHSCRRSISKTIGKCRT